MNQELTLEEAENIVDNMYQNRWKECGVEDGNTIHMENLSNLKYNELESASILLLRTEIRLKKENQLLKEINEEHKKLNGELREENKKYKEVIKKVKKMIIDNIEATTYEYIGSNKIKVLRQLRMDNDGVNKLLDILKDVK